jgi:hypothetical protein
MGSRRTVIRTTCGLLLAVSLGLLGWTLIPGARHQVRLEPPPVRFTSLILQPGSIQFDVPENLRMGEGENFRIWLDVSETGVSQPVLVIARLELPGTALAPGPEIQTPLSTSGITRFAWEIERSTPGDLAGTLWLTMQLGDERQTILAYPLRFTESRLLGLSWPTSRLLGWIGLVASLAGLAFGSKRN